MKLLLTRPYEDSFSFQKLLSEKYNKNSQLEFVINPLLEIQYSSATIKYNNPIFIVTSINSARALAKTCSNKNSRVITVGLQSKEEIESKGFKNVESAVDATQNASEEAIINYIKSNIEKSQELIHISAEVTKGGLKTNLEKLGFNYKKVVGYSAKSLSLEAEIISQIQHDKITALALFSPRTARIFMNQVDVNKLQPYMKSINAFCLSKNVADILPEKQFNRLLIPQVTNTENFANMIANYN